MNPTALGKIVRITFVLATAKVASSTILTKGKIGDYPGVTYMKCHLTKAQIEYDTARKLTYFTQHDVFTVRRHKIRERA